MIEYKDEPIIKKVPSKTICDRCGVENDFNLGAEMVAIRHEYGYGSSKDGDYIEFDLCEKCLDETIKTMNIKVRIYENKRNTNG